MSTENKADGGCVVTFFIGLALGFTLPMGLGANIWIALFLSILSGLGLGIFYIWAKDQ